MSEVAEEKNIYQALTAIMKEVGSIGKGQKNKQQGFNFRGIDDVYNHVQPIMAKYGVFSVPSVLNERSEDRETHKGGTLIYRILTIKYTFYASDGTSVEATVIGEGMDSGDKGANKAMAVGHKYALLQVLSIPTQDMVDPDSETPTMTESDLKPPRNGPENFESDSPSENGDGKSKKKDPYYIIPEKDFQYGAGFEHLVKKADGDIEYVKKLLKDYGVTSSSHITYDIYKKAWGYMTVPRKEAQ